MHYNTEGLPEWFTNHPMTAKIIEEQREAIIAQRREQVAELERIEKEEISKIPHLMRAVGKAKTEYEHAEQELKKIKGKLWAAAADLRGVRYQIDRRQQEAEVALRALIDPAISDALSFFREKIDALRKTELKFQEYQAQENPITGKQAITRWTNSRATLEAINFCRAAIKELEKMVLRVEPDTARIEELKAGIPDHNRETIFEFVKERPEGLWS